MNEAHFFSCFNIIVEAHGCQMVVGDDMVGFNGNANQKNKCAAAMETILGFYLFSDIPETVLGWPV